jgi:hypothetical protein
MNPAFCTHLSRIGRLAGLVFFGTTISGFGLANTGPVTFTVPTITISPEQATVGATGFAEVTATNSGTDNSYQIGEDMFLNPLTSGVSVIAGDYSTAAPYLFGGNSSNVGNGAPVFVDPLDPSNANQSEVEQSDQTASLNTFTTLTSTPNGIVRFEYSVPAGTVPGTYPITLIADTEGGSGTFYNNISTADATLILPSVINGAIVVQAVATPEPTSIILMLFGAAGLISYSIRRRHRA